jgi:hypothetical protein
LLHLLVFNAYINDMHGSRSKIPSKKISSGSAARRNFNSGVKALNKLRYRAEPDIILIVFRPAQSSNRMLVSTTLTTLFAN